MHRSRRDSAVRSLRRAQHLDSRPGTAFADVEAKPITLLADFPESHCFQHLDGTLVSLLAERN